MAGRFCEKLRKFFRTKVRRSKEAKSTQSHGRQPSLQISAPTNFVHLTGATGTQTFAATTGSVAVKASPRVSNADAHDATAATAKNNGDATDGHVKEEGSDDGAEEEGSPGAGAGDGNGDSNNVKDEEATEAGELEPASPPTIFGSTKPDEKVTAEVAEAMKEGPLGSGAGDAGDATR
ncbi:MAG: hypothetical protein M1831_002752 [Alyxoria varia]|nr:MAG: hypothetical protein M1831_002752 [Alyxoria varia]